MPYGTRRYARPAIRRPAYGRRKRSTYSSRKNYNAASRSRTMVVTNSRTSNSANRVGAGGLSRISVGRFRDLPTLWPDKMMMKLKYYDTVNTTLTVGSSTYTAYIPYRVNSLYDPLLSTALEQPIAGYAELANMYQNYRVHAAKMTSNAVPNGSDAAGALFTTGFSRNGPAIGGTSTYATVLNSLGNPYVVWALIGAQAADPVNLENYCSMKKIVGSNAMTFDDDFAGGYNSNPTATIYGYVAISLPTTPSAAVVFTVVTEIEFFCEFYGRDHEIA